MIILPFQFSQKHRGELTRNGLNAVTIAEIESLIGEITAFYATTPPTSRQTAKRLKAFAGALNDVDVLDDVSAAVVGAEATACGAPAYHEFKSSLVIYAAAALKKSRAVASKSGPEVEKETHFAIEIGKILQRAAIMLDDKEKGLFVVVCGVAFDAIGMRTPKAGQIRDLRNDVRRALKYL